MGGKECSSMYINHRVNRSDIEVKIFLSTVVERNDSKCCELPEKSWWKVLGQE